MGSLLGCEKNKVTYKIKENADLLISSPLFEILGKLDFSFQTHPHHEVMVVGFNP